MGVAELPFEDLVYCRKEVARAQCFNRKIRLRQFGLMRTEEREHRRITRLTQQRKRAQFLFRWNRVSQNYEVGMERRPKPLDLVWTNDRQHLISCVRQQQMPR